MVAAVALAQQQDVAGWCWSRRPSTTRLTPARCRRLARPRRLVVSSVVVTASQTHAAIETVVRMEWARLDRRARPVHRRRRAGRGTRPGRGGRRAGAMAGIRSSPQRGCLADDRGQAPGRRSVPPEPGTAPQVRPDRPGAGGRGDRRHPRLRRGRLRPHRRRPAAADIHRLPPGPPGAGQGRADAATGRRADHRRDRARLSRTGADDRAADCASQEDPGQRAGAVRSAGPRRPARPALVRAGSHLSHLQRGLLGHRRRRLDAPGAVRGRGPPGPHPGPARPRGTRSARARGPDGDPGVPGPGPHRAHAESRSCCWTRTGDAGTGC